MATKDVATDAPVNNDDEKESEGDKIVVSRSIGYLLVLLAFLGLCIDWLHTTCAG